MAMRRAPSNIFRQVRDMAPDNPEVIGGLVRALVAAGEAPRGARDPRCASRGLATKPEIARARAALEVASAAPAADTPAFEARLAADPDDHEARFELANAQDGGGDRDGAADGLLELIRRDREWNDGAAPQAVPPAAGSAGPRRPLVERAAPPPLGRAVHMSRTLRVPDLSAAGAILFPRSQLPLHIFEPRYREMVRDAIDGAGRIAMIQPHRLDDDNQAPLYGVGCVGDIVGVEELDDGRFNIVLLGTNRFRLLRRS